MAGQPGRGVGRVAVNLVAALVATALVVGALVSASVSAASDATVASATPTPTGTPDALTITSVTPGITTLSIAYSGPTNGGTVEYVSVTLNGVPSQLMGTPNPIELTGLTPDTAYTVTVAAGNSVSLNGPDSAPWSGRTLAAAPAPAPSPTITAPGAPGIVVGTVTATSVEWTVGVPTSVGGEAPTVYSSGIEGRGEASFNPEQRTRSATGLRPNTEYVIVARARNSAGSSPDARATFRTLAAIPDAPVVTVTPSERKVAIRWTAPAANGATIRAYRVTDEAGRVVCSSLSTSCEVAVERSGKQVTFSVTAVTEDGTGRAGVGSAVLPVTTPGPVRNARSEYVNPCRLCTAYDLVVSWDPPSDDGGAPITSVTWDTGLKIKSGSSLVDFQCTVRKQGQNSCRWYGLLLAREIPLVITARNARGDGVPVTLTAGRAAATTATPPQAPVDLTASSAVGGISTLGWGYPTEVADQRPDSYAVDVFECGRSCSTQARSVQRFTCDPWGLPGTCLIRGLNPAAKHRVTVTAANANGQSSATVLLKAEASVVPPAAPSVPRSVTASDAVYAVTVAWTPPVSEGSAPIEGYRVRYGWGAIACTVPPTSRSCKVDFSNPGPKVLSVEAFSEDGTGPTASVTGHPRLPGAPGAPQRVSALPGSGRVLVSWDPDFTTNQESFAVLDASGSRTLCTAPGSARQCTVAAPNGQEATFLVEARGGGLTSSRVRTPKVTPSTIPTVTKVKAETYRFARSVTVSFSPISRWGFDTIGYVATASPGGRTCVPTVSWTGDSMTCTISGLDYGSYTAVVTASGGGASSTSGPVSFTLLPPPPKPDPPVNPVVTVSPGGFIVTWQPPATAGAAQVTKYKVMALNGQTCEVPASTFTCTFTGVPDGAAWMFSLSSLNELNESTGVSTGYAIAGPPSVPSGVRAESVGGRDVVVTWDADGQSVVESTVVRAVPGPGICEAPGRAASCRITGLGLGVRQTFEVVRRNGAGYSLPVRGGDVILELPSIPLNPTLVMSGTTARISWGPPTSTGSPALERYAVRQVGGREVCSTSDTSCAVAGLTRGQSVRFEVAAVNSVGASPTASTESIIVGAPLAPNSLRLSQVGPDVVVTWQPPEGWVSSPGNRFELSSNVGSCSTTATRCVLAKPGAGTNVQVTVRSVNDAGSSAAVRSSITVIGKPGRPTGVVVEPFDRKFLVEWDPVRANTANPPERYTVSILEFPFRVREVCDVPAGVTQCEIIGLENGMSYGVAIAGVNTVGMGPGSDPVFSVPQPVVETATTIPGPVTDVRVDFDESTRKAVISWKAPSDKGGARRLEYVVLVVDRGLEGYGCLTRALSCTVAIGDTTYSKGYSVFVQARNSVGFQEGEKPPDATFDVPKNR